MWLLCLFAAIGLAGCSTQKNTAKSRWWQSFTARYNTYYNGSQAYIEGTQEQAQGHKDNFTERLPLYVASSKKSQNIGKSHFDRAIEKSEKTIKQHSIKAKPEWNKSRRKTAKDKEWLSRREYNPFLWRAWLLLGQSQFSKGAFDESAATFSYMSRLYQTQPAINCLARAWLARCYTELDWLYDAEDVIRNMKRDSIHYRAQAAWDETMADYYISNGELEQALPYLRKTIRHEHQKTQKAREWFLLGQLQAALGQRQAAYKAYQKVMAQNPPYELEFNARIAQTEVLAQGNYRKMITRLKRMAGSDNNKEYLDQVYYAIGNIYLMQKDTMHAIGAYEKGNEGSTRNGIEKGVLLLRLGGLYWDMERYADAQRCYGEAIGLLDKDRPDYEQLAQRSKVLDELVPYTDAVHLQDSLQELAHMPEKERLAAIDRVIEALKKKEKEERDKAREAEVEQALQKQGAVGNRNPRATQTSQMGAAATKDGQWYFYNQMAVNQGKQQFQRLWGKRENVDNWQRINQTVVALPGTSDSEEQTDSLSSEVSDLLTSNDSIGTKKEEANDTLANDPHHREYYLAQIPFTEEQMAESDQTIMDGLFHSGIIFKDKLDNLPLSEKQLRRLTRQYTDYEQMDVVWYHLFLLYSRQGRFAMADSCLAHMQNEWAESEWTILLSDPYFTENARFGEHIEDSIYAATYEAFKQDRHAEIKSNAQLTAERFPLGANRPKFIFIYGLSLLNEGDAKGCLEQMKMVVEKYPQSEVSEMAGMIVKGVQEGRPLHGGKFDLDDIWSRRGLTLNSDSTSTDTLSAERDTPYLFILAYEPDSLAAAIGDGRTATQMENQLLYELARYNFSNFLVRNFDLAIDRSLGISRMMVSGFLNFDEALQYARQLRADEHINSLLHPCRTIVISEHNLSLIGSHYSYRDYDEFYERTFMPLPLTNEELLNTPETIEQESMEESEPNEDTPTTISPATDFDDEFFP